MDFLSLEMSKGGFENILIITDHFTRFAQAIPAKNQTAHTTAKLLFENFICHYGFPSRFHSDQGRNFESEVILELCNIAHIEKTRTTPYHPQGNGMPERFNETLMNMLGTLEEDRKSNWRAHVPALVHAYNSTPHSSTGYTPHFLMFGRHPRLAIDAFLGIEPNRTKPTDKSTYVSGLRSRLNFAYKAASREARKQGQRHKKWYDLRVREAKVEIGDRVLVRNVGIRGKAKLADRWEKNVYVVVSQPTSDIPIFEVKREHGKGKHRLLHRNLLLPLTGIPISKRKACDPEISVDHKSDSGTSPGLCPNNHPDTFTPTIPNTDNSVQQNVDSSISDSSGKYIIPARRNNQSKADGKLSNQNSTDKQKQLPCQSDEPFRRQRRNRAQPAWMRNSSWQFN
jgi:hypothetical protein